jgi:hypothetical protein
MVDFVVSRAMVALEASLDMRFYELGLMHCHMRSRQRDQRRNKC